MSMKYTLALLAGAALAGPVGTITAANATEPMQLTTQQMDGVAAGFFFNFAPKTACSFGVNCNGSGNGNGNNNGNGGLFGGSNNGNNNGNVGNNF